VPIELALRKLNLKTLNFLNGGLIGTPFAADDACELHCQERGNHLKGVSRYPENSGLFGDFFRGLEMNAKRFLLDFSGVYILNVVASRASESAAGHH
jgi:hypothetical protein